MSLKIYSIRNKEKIYGYLFINNNLDDCYIELIKDLDEYPAFFNMFALNNEYMINSDWTYKWIKERIIPYERQNINNILKDNKIPFYNELLMLISSKAHSSMDDNYIEEIKYNELDENIKKRMDTYIMDFIYSRDYNNLTIFFKNNKTKCYKIKDNINTNPFLSKFCNEIIFNIKTRYSYLELYENGNDILLSYNDLKNYMNENILSSSQISEEFNFSRQYLNKLKKEGKIEVLNNNLYLKNNINALKK